jgi:hypothetical protein
LFKVRDELTNGLKRVGATSPAKEAFRIMRAACREFLTLHSVQAQEHNRGMMRDIGYQQEELFVGLGKLRATLASSSQCLGICTASTSKRVWRRYCRQKRKSEGHGDV